MAGIDDNLYQKVRRMLSNINPGTDAVDRINELLQSLVEDLKR
jgi:hypothetical protein